RILCASSHTALVLFVCPAVLAGAVATGGNPVKGTLQASEAACTRAKVAKGMVPINIKAQQAAAYLAFDERVRARTTARTAATIAACHREWSSVSAISMAMRSCIHA